MVKFTDFGEEKYTCDECKEIFKGKEIVLKVAPTNFNILTPLGLFTYIDKDGFIKGGLTFPDGHIGDQMLHCPKCNRVHMYGLDLYIEKKEKK